MLAIRKFLSAAGLLTIVQTEFKKIASPRELASHKKVISYADCLMSAFAMFSLKFPSLLQFDASHRLDPQIQHNLRSLYGIEQIPCDTYMRERIDEGIPSTLRRVYKRLFAFLQRGKALESYSYLGGRYLLAGDGTGFFASQKVHCKQCCIKYAHKSHIKICNKLPMIDSLIRQHSYILTNPLGRYFKLHYLTADRKFIDVPLNEIPGLNKILAEKKIQKELSKLDKQSIKEAITAYHHTRCCDGDDNATYYHNMYCAALVHPDIRTVIPLVPEPIIKEDGEAKNDCERNASKRLYRDFKREHPHLKVIVVEDCLASNFPHLDELKRLDMQFIIGAKPGDHQALFKWVDEQECTYFEHATENGVTHRYRYINNAPLNKSHSDFKVNFVEYWETNKKAQVRHWCWVTDISITDDNVYHIMRGGRSNWKIENPIFNTLKNHNYHFGHNFGHGNKSLSTMLAMLMMLAFLVDQVQELCCNTFQQALKKRETKIGLWTKMKSVFTEHFFDNWNDLFQLIIHGPVRIQQKINST
jgi:hypothetical protein